MRIELPHLSDSHLRELMLSELEIDVASRTVHLSTQMTEAGHAQWRVLLRQAIENHDAFWLTRAISHSSYWHTHYVQQRKIGQVTARVPSDAAPKLANGEFIVYYIRAVCLLALERGDRDVQVVRVRESANPRAESLALLGTRMDAAALLEDVRTNRYNYALGVPPGPNSGLAVALV